VEDQRRRAHEQIRRNIELGMAGKVRNARNTAAGLAYGLMGYSLGVAAGTHPKIRTGHNGIEFINNPHGGRSAIMLGNTITYAGDPYDPKAPDAEYWRKTAEHERQHTLQGEQLGSFYLPSNIAGGLAALVRDHSWHGKTNWNEVGPQMNPSRPWAWPKPDQQR